MAMQTQQTASVQPQKFCFGSVHAFACRHRIISFPTFHPSTPLLALSLLQDHGKVGIHFHVDSSPTMVLFPPLFPIISLLLYPIHLLYPEKKSQIYF